MRLIVWLLRAFLFFALFAFALNNQQDVAVRWFFGHEWHAPLVIVVLLVFGIGCALGVLAMVPAWWRHRRLARRGRGHRTCRRRPDVRQLAASRGRRPARH